MLIDIDKTTDRCDCAKCTLYKANLKEQAEQIARLKEALEQALSDFRFIQRAFPTSNFQSSIIKMELALAAKPQKGDSDAD